MCWVLQLQLFFWGASSAFYAPPTLSATTFPYPIEGVKLDVNNDKDFLFSLLVEADHALVEELKPFPGLWNQNEGSEGSRAFITGTVGDIQLFLDQGLLRIIPPIDWLEEATLHFSLADEDGIVLGRQDVVVDMELHVPFHVAISPSFFEISEDEVLAFRHFKLNLPRSNNTAHIACDLTAEHGRIVGSEIFNGTFVNAIQIFQSSVYRPDLNFHGLDTIEISCESNLQESKSNLEVRVNSVNDQPQILLSRTSFTIEEDSAFQLNELGLELKDLDYEVMGSDLIAVELELDIGNLKLPGPSLLGGIRSTNISSSRLRLVGHIERVNRALQFISVSFPSSWFGEDTIRLKCTDNIVMTENEMVFDDWILDSVSIVVTSVNDAPHITIDSNGFTAIRQGDTISLEGYIELFDVDGAMSDLYYLTMETHQIGGDWAAEFVVNLDQRKDNLNITKLMPSKLQLAGNLSTLSHAVDRIKLSMKDSWFGNIPRGLVLILADSHGASFSAESPISVLKVSNRPIFHFSTLNIVAREDEPFDVSSKLQMSISIGNEFMAHDESGERDMYEIHIHSNGHFHFHKWVSDCYISDLGSYRKPRQNMRFTGTLKGINSALQGALTYTPPSNLDTNDVLVFVIYAEEEITDRVEIWVDLESVNDPPMLEEPEVEEIFEADGSRNFSLRGMHVEDNDGDNLNVFMTLSPKKIGYIKQSVERLEETIIDADGSSLDLRHYTMEGNSFDLNSALKGLSVSVEHDFSGTGTLFVNVIDRHGVSSNATISLHVDKIHSYPRLMVLTGPVTIDEDVVLYFDNLLLFDESKEMISEEVDIELRAETTKRLDTFSTGFEFFMAKMVGGVHFPFQDFKESLGQTIIMRGTVERLNKALEQLLLKPPLDFYGNFTISVKIPRKGSAVDIVQRIDVHVEPLDDDPVILWDGIQLPDERYFFIELYEDDTVTLDKFVFQDVDNHDAAITFRALNGNICFDDEGRGITCESNVRNVTMVKSLDDINKNVQKMLYRPRRDWWGVDRLYVTAETSDKQLTLTLDVHVKPINDFPVVKVPNTTIAIESLTQKIIGVSIQDPDLDFSIEESREMCTTRPSSCSLTVQISVHHGKVSFPHINGIAKFEHTNETTFMIGSIKELNRSLKGMIYTSPQKYHHDSDLLIIEATDSEGLKGGNSLRFVIKQSYHQPLKMSIPSNFFLELEEDATGIIGGDDFCGLPHSPGGLTIITCKSIHIDEQDEDVHTTVNLTTTSGYIKLPQMNRNSGAYASNSGSRTEFTSSIHLAGSLRDINEILEVLYFKGSKDFNSRDGSLASVKIKVQDYRGDSTEEVLSIYIAPVPDQPVIEIKSGIYYHNQSGTDASSYKMIGVQGNTTTYIEGISVKHVDCTHENDLLELTMRSSFGYISLLGQYSPIRQWISGYRGLYSEQQEIIIQSSVSEINEALRSLAYTPPPNQYSGDDHITLSIADPTNKGFPKKYEVMIAVQVNLNSGLLHLQAPHMIHMKEDCSEVINLRLVGRTSQFSEIEVSISFSNGRVKLLSELGLVVEKSATNMRGVGSLDAWNNALSALAYTPPRDWYTRNDQLEVITFEVYGMELTSHTIFINIEEQPDCHRWMAPGENKVLQPSGDFTVVSIDTIQVEEDNTTSLTVALIDADELRGFTDVFYRVQISSFAGARISLSSHHGIFVKGKTRSDVLSFEATLPSLNNAMRSILYDPLPNFNGPDVITLSASDGNLFNVTTKIPVEVTPRYDIPVIQTPFMEHCFQDYICDVLREVDLIDPDESSMLEITIHLAVGGMSFSGHVQGVSSTSGSREGISSFTLTGSANSINSSMHTMIYLLPSHQVSAPLIDTITFTVFDEIGEMKSETTLEVFVSKSSKRPPSIRYHKNVYHDDEECSSFFSDDNIDKLCKGLSQNEPMFCIADLECLLEFFTVSGDVDLSSIYEMRISVSHGQVYFKSISRNNEQRGSDVIIHGTVEQVNEALRSLSYTPDANYFGKDVLHMNIASSMVPTKFNPMAHSLDMDIIVSAKYDTLQLFVPEKLYSVNEDDYLALDGISLTRVANDDDESIIALIFIIVSNGRIKLTKNLSAVEVEDLSTIERNEWYTHVSICGSAIDVSKVLGKISFNPNLNWNSDEGDHGDIVLDVGRVESCENKSNGASKLHNIEDSISLAIHVKSVNDDPVILIDKYSLFTIEDHETRVHLEIEDVDSTYVKVSLDCNEFGRVAVSHYHEHISDEGGDFHESITLRGTIQVVNENLLHLRFLGNKNYHGKAGMIYITATDDLGGFDSIELNIAIDPVEEDLIIWSLVDSSLHQPIPKFQEGERRIIASDWLFDSHLYTEASMSHDGQRLRPHTGLRPFTVSDGDAAFSTSDALVCVKVTTDSGIISISKDSSVTFNTDSRGKELEYVGTISRVNKVSQTLMFEAVMNESGLANIGVMATKQYCDEESHLCTCNFDMPDTKKGTFHTFVTKMSTLPSISWPRDSTKVLEAKIDAPMHITGLVIDDRDITDEGLLTLDITVSRGILSLRSTYKLSFLKGVGSNDTNAMQVLGTRKAINEAISPLSYTCRSLEDRCEVGSKVDISIRVSENRFTGQADQVEDQIAFTVKIS